MRKPNPRFTVVFPDPDTVGQSEYRAIYDAVVDGAFNGAVPDRIMTKAELELVREMVDEFVSWGQSLQQKLA